MKYRLFDTSVWIDFRNGIKSPQTDLLTESLKVNKACYCPVILQEFLQGIKIDRDFNQYEEDFNGLHSLVLDPYFVARSAAEIYRSIRKRGITIRKPNDCLIAFYAIHFDIELCHNDIDFEHIAQNTSLKIWKPI